MLVVAHLNKKFLRLLLNWIFITVLTRGHQWALSWVRWRVYTLLLWDTF